MSLIIILGSIFAIYKVIAYASALSREHRRQTEIERIKREQSRQREAWKAAQAAERDRVRQMEVIKREQAKQAKEQARIAKEQEKQAAQIEKHEKRISDLEFKVAKVERNISDIDEKLSDFYAQLDALLLQQAGLVPGSKQFDALQNKIVTKRDQIRRGETKRFELMHTRDTARKELSAA